MSDLAERLLRSFTAELTERVGMIDDDVLALETNPGDPERLGSLFRSAHTIKGAARAAGVLVVERICHEAESRLAAARDSGRPLDAKDIEALLEASRVLGKISAALSNGASIAELGALDGIVPPGGKVPVDGPSEPTGGSARRPVPADPPPVAQRPAKRVTPAQRVPPESTPGTRAAPEAALRVSRRKVDDLHAAVMSLSMETDRVSGLAATADRLLDSLGAAAGSDVRRSLGRFIADARRTSRSLRRASDGLVDITREVRLSPFRAACGHLPRAARDLAAEVGKQVSVTVVGEDVEVDRAVIDALRDPLLQLVRNAVDHGIESPAERSAAGKAARGEVRISAEARGDRLTIHISDDGRGVDVNALRASLPPEYASADEPTLARALLGGGVSTRSEASMVSGRGVGLEIVKVELGRIQGTVSLSWAAGRGTTFVLETPVSLASTTVVLARVQSWTVAFPAAYVARMVRPREDSVRRSEGRDVLLHDGDTVPLAPLARLLGPPFMEAATPSAGRIVVLHAESRRAAVLVEELVETRDALMVPAASAALSSPLVVSATILSSGEAVPVLNVPALLASDAWAGAAGMTELFRPTDSRARPARVLVVDDSITTRTLERSVLESEGFEVVTAADGAEAWSLLQGDDEIELVVTDVEMPRMDGFELCRAIRTSIRRKDLPVVLVTARETPEDRKRGLDVGADAYLGKSGFDQAELVGSVRRLLDGGVR